MGFKNCAKAKGHPGWDSPWYFSAGGVVAYFKTVKRSVRTVPFWRMTTK
jgi:hypothetical protein